MKNNTNLKWLNFNAFRMFKSFYFSLFIVCFYTTFAQTKVGQWNAHNSYNNSVSVAVNGNDIYCANRTSFFIFNKQSNSIETYTRVDGLSDVGITKIRFHKASNTLFIGYETGNIDIYRDGKLSKIDDIKRANVLASKKINDFYFVGNDAYISTGFGILWFDIQKLEFKDTYYILQTSIVPVNGVVFNGTTFFAATEQGVYEISKNTLDLNSKVDWQLCNPWVLHTGNYNCIGWFNDKVLVNLSIDGVKDTIYEYTSGSWKLAQNLELFEENKSFDFYKNEQMLISHEYNCTTHYPDFSMLGSVWTYGNNLGPWVVESVFDEEAKVWIADRERGLGNSTYNLYLPNGPSTNFCSNVYTFDNKIFVATGGRFNSNGNNRFRPGHIHYYENYEWKTLDYTNTEGIYSFLDIMSLAYNPVKNTLYASSLGYGIMEFENLQKKNVFDYQNSSLQDETSSPAWFYTGIPSLSTDKNNNLWATNNRCLQALHVKTADENKWYGFSIPPLNNTLHIRNFIITRNGNKWIQVLDGSNPGIVVFNENGTFDNASDDQWKVLSVGEGKGNLPSVRTFALTEDKNGDVWVGTEGGLVVFFSPDNILNENIDASNILVDHKGYTEILLEGQNILSIFVDGANRKWISAEGNGVYLLSPDGKEEIYHFTKENSPLISNDISSITVDPNSGEVFFATEEGMVSFRADATEGTNTYDRVLVFPNPIKTGYSGPISITNLVTNSTVKITDMVGNLVFETTAKGGQATWYGTDYNGQRVHSGVYLIYCYTQDGMGRYAGKMVFIK